jgi:AraC family transcriptional regulator
MTGVKESVILKFMPQPIRIETSAALILAGVNQRYKVGPEIGMKLQWEKFMEDFGRIDGQVGMKAYGVCHDFGSGGAVSSETAYMDYLAGAEVTDGGQVPGYLHVLKIPKRKVAVFLHEGPLEKISETWGKIFSEWLPAAKLEVAQGAQFEIYGEEFYADDAGAKVEIHIPVK